MILINIDGSLTTTRSGEAYGQHPHDYEVLPQAAIALRRIKMGKPNQAIVGISDQATIEAGCKTFEDCVMEQRWKLLLIREVDAVLFCPNAQECWIVRRALDPFPLHTSQYGSPSIGRFQMPGSGLIQTALRYWQIGPEATTTIGTLRIHADAATAAGTAFLVAADWWKMGDRFVGEAA